LVCNQVRFYAVFHSVGLENLHSQKISHNLHTTFQFGENAMKTLSSTFASARLAIVAAFLFLTFITLLMLFTVAADAQTRFSTSGSTGVSGSTRPIVSSTATSGSATSGSATSGSITIGGTRAAVTTSSVSVTVTTTSRTTPLYISFNSHNEEDDYTSSSASPYASNGYENATVFSTLRSKVKEIADVVRSGGAKWDWQSDWRFLVGTANNDPNRSGRLADASTNYKTIVKWLAEDNGTSIAVSPHAHENAYNYADVAYLFGTLGVTPGGVVGGFTYNSRQGTNGGRDAGYTWDSLARGLQGRMYTSTRWTPTILYGGASVNSRGMTDHANDIHALGIWKPTSTSSFFTHVSTNSLTVIGNGFESLLSDTSSAENIANIIIATLDTLRRYPAGKLYSASIGIHQKYFTSSGYTDKIARIIELLQSYVASGQMVWATHTEKVALWRTLYRSEANFAPYYEGYTPSSPSSSSSSSSSAVSVSAAPNPASSTVVISFSGIPSFSRSVTVQIVSATGSVMASQTVSSSAGSATFDVSSLANGTYSALVSAGSAGSRIMLIVSH
jgi:hypothetical protein